MMLNELDLLLDVSQDCINKGLRENVSQCPIALAVDNAVRAKGLNPYDITVDGDIMVDELAWDGATTEEKQFIYDFISNFDNEKEVQPFQMKIHLRRFDRDYGDEDEDY